MTFPPKTYGHWKRRADGVRPCSTSPAACGVLSMYTRLVLRGLRARFFRTAAAKLPGGPLDEEHHPQRGTTSVQGLFAGCSRPSQGPTSRRPASTYEHRLIDDMVAAGSQVGRGGLRFWDLGRRRLHYGGATIPVHDDAVAAGASLARGLDERIGADDSYGKPSEA